MTGGGGHEKATRKEEDDENDLGKGRMIGQRKSGLEQTKQR